MSKSSSKKSFGTAGHSYASLSLTVSFEALQAGNALAMVARMIVKFDQTMIPPAG